ncbi:MAG: Na+/H+ antiporter NhaA [Propionibacteriaceae bacterium]|nr:Na+/H+ antiporter NhaA [Micropruina sp.]HBX81363.1 Na+/H+ antiporter NhaA [Propionibacteriaceae bacterium]
MTTTIRTLQRASRREWRRVKGILRTESVGGFILLGATVAALVCANLTPNYYKGLRDTQLGFDVGSLHLSLTVGHWTSDGLLAVFFFLAGLELKREFVAGDLRDPRRALAPIVAAACGVAVPALLYAAINVSAGPEALRGWAIPSATDIAFALAVLAVIGSHLPGALRVFLLTLAVVDDLIAIIIIAVFYSGDLKVGFLIAAFAAIGVFGLVVRHWRRWFEHTPWAAWVVLWPLAFLAWALLYNSGIHATIAGVLMAFTVPVEADDPDHDLAADLEHRLRPLSAGVAVPLFAFFAAGVVIQGPSQIVDSLTSSVGLGIMVALVLGKMIGISGGTYVVTRLPGSDLHPDLAWVDVVGVSMLAGIGFTVSLLINDLSFDPSSPNTDTGKIAILSASVLAAVLASLVLGARNRHYRALEADEPEGDDDLD